MLLSCLEMTGASPSPGGKGLGGGSSTPGPAWSRGCGGSQTLSCLWPSPGPLVGVTGFTYLQGLMYTPAQASGEG